MNDIEAIYMQYEDIVAEFSEQVIKNRYSCLYKECMAFLESLEISDHVRIDETILIHAVMDYFTDISRIRGFHQIRHISELKVISYETYWLLRRKPFQVVSAGGDEEFWAFINEKFAFTRIASFLTRGQNNLVLEGTAKKSFLNFLDTLYYYLKYREYDPKMLELIIMGFQAGQLIH